MIINTNTVETNTTSLNTFESKRWIKTIHPCKRVHFTSQKTIADRFLTPTSLFVAATHRAFSDHYPFTFAPETIWLIIQQEIGTYVKENASDKKIASLFTRDNSKKVKLIVDLPFGFGEEVDWTPHLENFRPMLKEAVPSRIMDIMTPSLSTETPATRLAHLVSFMDCASEYYDFGGRTLCGIPEFKITGTVDDWEKIEDSIIELSLMLPGLAYYFEKLSVIIKEVKTTLVLGYGEPSFWNSFYKSRSDSGGPYVNGWINDLYAFIYHEKGKEFKTERTNMRYVTAANFGTNFFMMDFEWDYLGRKVPMGLGAGIVGIDMIDGFITPQVGVTVVEKD